MTKNGPQGTPEGRFPENIGEALRSVRERLIPWIMDLVDGPNPPTDQAGLTRRRLLVGGAAMSIVGAGVGVCAVEAESAPAAPAVLEEAEVEPLQRTITFFGETIAIEEGPQFDERLKDATQALLLKFTPRGKEELNEVYWPRALEDFRQVLVRMGRYESFIQEVAAAMGLHPDVIAFFGIEAGFDPFKRSPSGYCGIGQVGEDAVTDVTDELTRDYKRFAIPEDKMNDWYDLRYDALHGIVNGLAYVKHLYEERVPETVQQLLGTHRGLIKEWLNKETRWEEIEKKFGWLALEDEGARYERLVKKILGEETIDIVRPTFVIPAYNMGPGGLARLVFLNYLRATLENDPLLRERRLSIFDLDASLGEDSDLESSPSVFNAANANASDTDAKITGFDLDFGLSVHGGEKKTALQERNTYLWQSYAFHLLAERWRATPADGVMDIDFKGTSHLLRKPATSAPEYREEERSWLEVQVPAGTDLFKLADHLELDERVNDDGTPVNRHHEAFRLNGNGAFARAGAYYGDPSNKKFNEGNVTIRLPASKVDAARAYLDSSGEAAKVWAYTIKKGDTTDGILNRLKRNNPGLTEEQKKNLFKRIFWGYNRIGERRKAKLQAGKTLALPKDLVID